MIYINATQKNIVLDIVSVITVKSFFSRLINIVFTAV